MDTTLTLFIAECTERLEFAETALLELEQTGVDRAALDAIFRALHTVKGDASMMRRAQVEWFAHIVENVLDRLRTGQCEFAPELVSLLLACIDHLRLLINVADPAGADDSGFAEAESTRLIGMLTPFLAEPITQLAKPAQSAQSSAFWHISMRFLPEVLRRGLDPLYFLQHLGSLGRIVRLHTLTDDLPALDRYNPEYCYLRFEVQLDTVADKQSIEDVFAFVADACQLHISPPRSVVQAYLRLIDALPVTDLRLGEMLVRIGALTSDELAEVLRDQRRFDASIASDRSVGALLKEAGLVASEIVDAALRRQTEIRVAVAQEHRYVKVPLPRLEQLAALLGELRAGLAPDASPAAWARLNVCADAALALATELQRQRLGEMFRGFYRFVRDACDALGKQAALFTSGGDLQLERSLAEPLREIVVHLLRNALDHGLELPAERLAAGKPALGNIHIDAWEEGHALMLSVTDDGAGVDRLRVLRRARALGLLSADERPGDEQLFALLFTAGFSTAEHVTHLSGRGVGLDVVLRGVQALGGEITISSLPARGAQFLLRVPGTAHHESIERASGARLG